MSCPRGWPWAGSDTPHPQASGLPGHRPLESERYPAACTPRRPASQGGPRIRGSIQQPGRSAGSGCSHTRPSESALQMPMVRIGPLPVEAQGKAQGSALLPLPTDLPAALRPAQASQGPVEQQAAGSQAASQERCRSAVAWLTPCPSLGTLVRSTGLVGGSGAQQAGRAGLFHAPRALTEGSQVRTA